METKRTRKRPQVVRKNNNKKSEENLTSRAFLSLLLLCFALLCSAVRDGTVRDAERVGPGNSWSCYFYTCATARGIECVRVCVWWERR